MRGRWATGYAHMGRCDNLTCPCFVEGQNDAPRPDYEALRQENAALRAELLELAPDRITAALARPLSHGYLP